jgi:hypothetical protein
MTSSRMTIMPEHWPQSPIWTGARQDTLPARHGLYRNNERVIGSGDARSREFRATPTKRPVASHRQSSPQSISM